MESLYWITTLGTLSRTISIIGGIVLCLSVIALVSFACARHYGDEDDSEKALKPFKVSLRCCIISGIFVIASLFVPSKQDLYMIYGVGSVIDYIESSDEAKKLPENAIKACNLYLEKNIQENSDTTSNK